MVGQEGVLDAGIGLYIANKAEPDGAVFHPGAGELDGLIAGQAFIFERSVGLNDHVLRL